AHGGDAWTAERLAESLRQVTDWVQPQRPRWLSAASERFLLCQQQTVDAPAAFARMSGPRGRRTAADLLSESSAPAGAVEIVAAEVDRVLFRDDRAIGVQAIANGETAAASWYAEQGVILCGG